MKNIRHFLLAIASGVLLSCSWYPYGFFGLIFLAFVPLFIISDELISNKTRFSTLKIFGYGYLTFLIWNGLTVWWISLAAIIGGVLAITVNALLMATVLACWHFAKTKLLKPVFSLFFLIFISFWAAFEFLHLDWDLNWPWLNLGNVFAAVPNLVQWYEYTGAFGGTIWVLVVNALLYWLYLQIRRRNKTLIRRTIAGIIAIITIPVVISIVILKTCQYSGESVEIVIVQPNTDPWVEQDERSNQDHIHKILTMTRPVLDSKTALLLCPESSISHTFLEEDDRLYSNEFKGERYSFTDSLRDLIHEFPQLSIGFGASTACIVNQKSAASRPYGEGQYIDHFNTAGCYNARYGFQFYHKSRLVPAVEKMPFTKILAPLENLAIDLGGVVGTLTRGEEQIPFYIENGIKVGLPICYESIYGEVFAAFVKQGAVLMGVITNDSWWQTSPGYRQHFEMSRLRAIETRRYIARAANTGTSAIIDPKGKPHYKTVYGEPAVIKAQVELLNRQTFYVRYGDYLARLLTAIA